MPQHRNAAERVRARLNEWAEQQGHGAGKQLAEAVQGRFGRKMSAQWASGVMDGKSDLRLKDLDAVAELLGLPPGDLVRRDNDLYIEVIPSEMKFLRHIRTLPDTVRLKLLQVWDYFLEIQESQLKAHAEQIDKRTKAARLQREQLRDKERQKMGA